MNFIETRGNDGIKKSEVSFSEAILSPSGSFGGLYVPKTLPVIDERFIQEHATKSYKDLAFNLLKRFEIDVEDEDLKEAISLYDRFDNKNIPVPIVKIRDNLYVNELYHGPTRAFKDMALQPFGTLLSAIAKRKKQNYIIMAATSGDTGPAALEGFKNKHFIKVVCLYPNGGTSDVQRLQMVTEDGDNQKVIGINGSFDDAQNSLKSLLANEEFQQELEKHNIKLSAANSVNFGRIIFQIVYHIHSYIQLLKDKAITFGEKIDLIVPSGNFGNALGGYYAKKMGLPINKIIITSNENNILTDLINSGKYDLRNRELKMTLSPAMDILKSSNVERVLFDKFGAERTKELMDNLINNNFYELTEEELNSLREDFTAFSSDDNYGKEIIKEYLTKYNYLMDPHTATCLKGFDENSGIKTVIYSTAEWTKFSPTVSQALNSNEEAISDLDALNSISNKFNATIPNMINELFNKEIKHDLIINKEDIQKEIIKFIS